MNVELDWQAENDDGTWERIATTPHGRPPTRWRWLWVTGVLAPLLMVTVSALVVARRYAQAQDRIAFQIQSVIDLETRALAEGDTALFLAQQDRALDAWYQPRAACAARRLQPVHVERSSSCAYVLADVAPGGTPLGSPPQVQAIGLRGEVAWAELILRPQDARQVRFYRQTAQGWLHTAPDAFYWGDALTQAHGQITVHCRERDLPHLDPLIAHIATVDHDLCAVLGWPAEDRLSVQFIPRSIRPTILDDRLVLASPWLSGIPAGGMWEQGYLDELDYWVTYARAAQFARAGATGQLKGVQQAVLDEYAFLHGGGDLDSAPLLGRIVRAYGAGAADEALRSLRDAPAPSQFIAQWPLAYPNRGESTGFAVLIEIAQEALGAGRLDSFRFVTGLLAEEGTWRAGTVEYLHETN